MSMSEPGRPRSTSLDRHASRTLRGERYSGFHDEPLRGAESGGSAPSQARRDSSSLAFEVSTHPSARMLLTHDVLLHFHDVPLHGSKKDSVMPSYPSIGRCGCPIHLHTSIDVLFQCRLLSRQTFTKIPVVA